MEIRYQQKWEMGIYNMRYKKNMKGGHNLKTINMTSAQNQKFWHVMGTDGAIKPTIPI